MALKAKKSTTITSEHTTYINIFGKTVQIHILFFLLRYTVVSLSVNVFFFHFMHILVFDNILL